LNASVVGVSPDPVKRHEKFQAKEDLDLLLLSDETHEMLEAYGVWKERSLYGKKYWGVERTTFVIDGKGVIRRIFPKVKVEGHADEVLKVVCSL
jgi:peroxiredoxin Q/BCP